MALRNLSPDRATGNYVPTITNITNLTTVTFLDGFFVVAGDVVTVYAMFTTDPTVELTLFSFELNLPFGIDITAVSDVIGVAGNGNGPEYGGNAIGVIATNTVLVASQHAGIAQTTVSFSYRTDT